MQPVPKIGLALRKSDVRSPSASTEERERERERNGVVAIDLLMNKISSRQLTASAVHPSGYRRGALSPARRLVQKVSR